MPIQIVGGQDYVVDGTSVFVSSHGESLITFLDTRLSPALSFAGLRFQERSLGGYAQAPEPSCVVLIVFAAIAFPFVRR
jgi:hypothetical protein